MFVALASNAKYLAKSSGLVGRIMAKPKLKSSTTRPTALLPWMEVMAPAPSVAVVEPGVVTRREGKSPSAPGWIEKVPAAVPALTVNWPVMPAFVRAVLMALAVELEVSEIVVWVPSVRVYPMLAEG